MNRIFLSGLLASSLFLSIGCASKKYVRNEVTPTVNKVNELDDLTAKNSRDIKDVDARAQQGILTVNNKTAEVEQKAQTAGQAADQAQQSATTASNRVTSLANTVANLDNYHPVVETAVHFAFNKDNLTKKAKSALDELGTEIPKTKSYIITVEGGADGVGSQQYNYGLSDRRADSVIQYLASKYNVPAHKIYLIGLGKDKPVATNKTAAGRAKNRRVDIRLMTNTTEGQQQQPAPSTGPAAQLTQPQGAQK
ncbi:MAG TPA: OmpA family protein [Terriglobales bacterium]|nr:OmpA family protein [Terriglobales bacterium]